MKNKIWISRWLIGSVIFFNLQAALMLLVWPQAYAGAFGVPGNSGALLVRGIGVLFVMWNIPYLFALADPVLNRVSLVEALLMQTIGLVGEVLMLAFGGAYPQAVNTAVGRFILFDSAGLILLACAFWITYHAHA